jgi:hypothetical protein
MYAPCSGCSLGVGVGVGEILGEREGTQKEREALVDEVMEMQQYITKLFPPVC